MIGDGSEDEKIDIYQNKNSETRWLLNIDMAADNNDTLDIMQNKKKRFEKMTHSWLAENLQNIFAVKTKEEYINLYRPKIEKYLDLEFFFNKIEPWSANIINKK